MYIYIVLYWVYFLNDQIFSDTSDDTSEEESNVSQFCFSIIFFHFNIYRVPKYQIFRIVSKFSFIRHEIETWREIDNVFDLSK